MGENICKCCLNNCCHNSKCNKKRKNISIINSVLIDESIVKPDSAIPFDANRIYVTDDIIISSETDFKICIPGIYKVTFTTNAKLYIGETNNNISIAVSINGCLIPGTIVKKSCGPNEIVNLYTQAVFSVASGTTAILNVINVKYNTPIIACDNANIIIERVG